MSKYEYGFEEWSTDLRMYTIKCDRKLTQSEIQFATKEANINFNGDTVEYIHKIPLDDGTIALVHYDGGDWGSADFEVTNGKENLADE
tara:strand:- start:265 stop:528 length:264 start_codon:yes stop_codon:yes gene_type:complete